MLWCSHPATLLCLSRAPRLMLWCSHVKLNGAFPIVCCCHAHVRFFLVVKLPLPSRLLQIDSKTRGPRSQGLGCPPKVRAASMSMKAAILARTKTRGEAPVREADRAAYKQGSAFFSASLRARCASNIQSPELDAFEASYGPAVASPPRPRSVTATHSPPHGVEGATNPAESRKRSVDGGTQGDASPVDKRVRHQAPLQARLADLSRAMQTADLSIANLGALARTGDLPPDLGCGGTVNDIATDETSNAMGTGRATGFVAAPPTGPKPRKARPVAGTGLRGGGRRAIPAFCTR